MSQVVTIILALDTSDHFCACDAVEEIMRDYMLSDDFKLTNFEFHEFKSGPKLTGRPKKAHQIFRSHQATQNEFSVVLNEDAESALVRVNTLVECSDSKDALDEIQRLLETEMRTKHKHSCFVNFHVEGVIEDSFQWYFGSLSRSQAA